MLQLIPAQVSVPSGLDARYNGCMEGRPQSYNDLIAEVRREFGVALEIVNTGGGNEAMHGRLESGHWLVVTDAEDFLSGINERRERDAGGNPLGWFAGVYNNDGSDDVDRPASHDPDGCLDYVQCDNASLDELNSVVREVLGRLALQSSRPTGGAT